MWANAKGSKVTCPFCRSAWETSDESVAAVQKEEGYVNDEGYVNVADQLGISGERGMWFYIRVSRLNTKFSANRCFFLGQTQAHTQVGPIITALMIWMIVKTSTMITKIGAFAGHIVQEDDNNKILELRVCIEASLCYLI